MCSIKYPVNSNIQEIARRQPEAQALSQQIREFYARRLQEAFEFNEEMVIKQVCAVLNQHTPRLVAIVTKTQAKKG